MQKKTDETIKVFQRNVQEYPNAWNPYDSLAEAYMAAGQKELAFKNYEKSLAVNSDNKNGAENLRKLKGKIIRLARPSRERTDYLSTFPGSFTSVCAVFPLIEFERPHATSVCGCVSGLKTLTLFLNSPTASPRPYLCCA
jgi:tetratricopeptide (TPR) repeat protein